jgi:hypothetical protein
MRITVSMALALLALLACEPPGTAPGPQAPARSTKLNESPRPMPARSPSSVTIYKVKPPEASFVEVYQLTELGENEHVALDTLRLSAARLGCDGLVIGGSRVETVAWHSVQTLRLSGTCIMFAQNPGTWQAPPPPDSPPPSEPLPQDAPECIQARSKIFATKDPQERARIIHSMPPSCHPR